MVSIPVGGWEMFNDLSLTSRGASAAGLKACSYLVASLCILTCILWDLPQRQATDKNSSTALEGAKATALNSGRPPKIYNQALSPTGPPSLAHMNNYRRFQCIPVRMFTSLSKPYQHN